MHFIDRLLAWATRSLMAGSALWLAGCSSTPTAPPVPQAQPPAAVPAGKPVPGPGGGAVGRPALPPLVRARDWAHFRREAALRIVAANPERTHDGPVQEPLLAIPVLEIELESDGRVRQIRVMRHPTQAKDTTQMAIDAVQRAGPFGSVAHLPRPWKFVEVFLFNDDRRFKPRTLDE